NQKSFWKRLSTVTTRRRKQGSTSLKDALLDLECREFSRMMTIFGIFSQSSIHSNIKKTEYYKSILIYLKELSILRRSTVVAFDSVYAFPNI
ncbi:9797_t:CDS:2, partial [Scutellospora calospora]